MKKPAKYLGQQETPHYNGITKAILMYKRLCFNAVDNIIAFIKEGIDQSEFKACKTHEMLLIDATHGNKYQDSLSDVFNICHQDVTAIEFEAQLESLKLYFDEKEDPTLVDNIEKTKELPRSGKVCFSQVINLLKI